MEMEGENLYPKTSYPLQKEKKKEKDSASSVAAPPRERLPEKKGGPYEDCPAAPREIRKQRRKKKGEGEKEFPATRVPSLINKRKGKARSRPFLLHARRGGGKKKSWPVYYSIDDRTRQT